jgi:hypothetical protein
VQYYEYLRYHDKPRQTKLCATVATLAASPFVLLPVLVCFGILFVPFVVVFETVKLLVLSWILLDLEQSKIKFKGFSAIMLSFLRQGQWKRKLAHIHICIAEHLMQRVNSFTDQQRYHLVCSRKEVYLQQEKEGHIQLSVEEKKALTQLMGDAGNNFSYNRYGESWVGQGIPVKALQQTRSANLALWRRLEQQEDEGGEKKQKSTDISMALNTVGTRIAFTLTRIAVTPLSVSPLYSCFYSNHSPSPTHTIIHTPTHPYTLIHTHTHSYTGDIVGE